MPINKDESGRRWVEVETIVPGTPEEVWKAIATGPGITSWFVPTQVDERVEGSVICNFGPGMESNSTIRVWEPPHRYVADSPNDLGPGNPNVATEWIVEARDGGTCSVRVVHSWFTDSDQWDDQFEGHAHGWRSFFDILRLYLARFSGQPCAPVQLVAVSSEPKDQVWAKLTGALGVTGLQEQASFESLPPAPRISGRCDKVGPPAFPELLLLELEEPAPGIASKFAMPMGGMTYLILRMYLFGELGAAVAAETESKWQTWLGELFPLPST